MNKGELRTHIKDVLNRTDITDALVDTFIFQTLSRIQRLLRIPSMEKTATQTVAGGYDGFVVPNDFLEINMSIKKLEITIVSPKERPLKYVSR